MGCSWWYCRFKGILFSRKVAKVIDIKPIRISNEEVIYEVKGQLFFVSKIYFIQGFDVHTHPAKVTIDMSKAHIWDQSGVGALDQIIRKLKIGGSDVEAEGNDVTGAVVLTEFRF